MFTILLYHIFISLIYCFIHLFIYRENSNILILFGFYEYCTSILRIHVYFIPFTNSGTGNRSRDLWCWNVQQGGKCFPAVEEHDILYIFDNRYPKTARRTDVATSVVNRGDRDKRYSLLAHAITCCRNDNNRKRIEMSPLSPELSRNPLFSFGAIPMPGN